MNSTLDKNETPDRSRPGSTTTAHTTGNPQGGCEKLATGVTIKLPTAGITIGTWNVRTLYATGKTAELTHELDKYKWTVVGLCEVRWTGFGEITTANGHKIWYSGDERIHQHGVAFIVNKVNTNAVIECTPVSSRIISIRLSASPHNLTIIQAYAPTSDYSDEQIEVFYEELEATLAKAPKKDLIVIQGDWNAKIGPDAYTNWAGTVGRFGIGTTNDRGLRLLEFANAHKLTLANTLHPHKQSRTVTWHSPDGITHNQIDFILTPQRYKSSINKAKTRTYPGADIGSDHDLVLCTMRLKLKNKRRDKRVRLRFDVEKLKDPKIAEMFQAQVGGKFAALSLLDNDIDTMSGNINHVLLSAAEEVLGPHRRKNKPWVTNDILDLCDKRRESKKRKHLDEEGRRLYQQANTEVRKGMRKAKEKWVYDQCLDIDIGMANGNLKNAFNTLKLLTKNNQTKSTAIEDKHGELITNQNEVKERWTEYCRGLYNYELQTDSSTLTDPGPRGDDTPPILKEEVEKAIKKLKIGKAPGIDNIPSELLRHGGEQTIAAITTLCQKILEQKNWPKVWTQSLVLPLPKKGNLKKCTNYRTISLISHPSKVMLNVIHDRLKYKAEEILAEEQAGFRPGKSTIQQVFNCRVITEKYMQHQQELYHNFIDFRKAFDRVWHAGLWNIMRNYNIDEGLIETIETLYSNATSAVLVNNEIGEFFATTVGVRQGCILSPTLFNIYLERIMQETLAKHQSSVSIGGRPLCNLRFADDIDLLATSEKELQNLTDLLVEASSFYGMEISTEKSQILVNSQNNRPAKIHVKGNTLEEVDQFKYLGVTLTKDGKSTVEIKKRIGMATAAMTRLNVIWKSSINLTIKLKLYKSLVTSILLYGCEAWTLTADLEKRICTFENKCYRKILRVSYREHRTNEDILEEITARTGRQEPLLSTVKRRKLSWFGHTLRHDGLCKTVLQGTVEGQRKRGRQRKQWQDNIKEWTGKSIQELNVTARNRDEWRRLVKSAARMSPRRSTAGHGS